jgi:hypothetical protein
MCETLTNVIETRNDNALLMRVCYLSVVGRSLLFFNLMNQHAFNDIGRKINPSNSWCKTKVYDDNTNKRDSVILYKMYRHQTELRD